MDNLESYLAKARSLALEAHAGQLDKAGTPYIIHAETVSQLVGDIISGWHQDSHDFQIKAQILIRITSKMLSVINWKPS